jgi:hypothetical protein
VHCPDCASFTQDNDIICGECGRDLLTLSGEEIECLLDGIVKDYLARGYRLASREPEFATLTWREPFEWWRLLTVFLIVEFALYLVSYAAQETKRVSIQAFPNGTVEVSGFDLASLAGQIAEQEQEFSYRRVIIAVLVFGTFFLIAMLILFYMEFV